MIFSESINLYMMEDQVIPFGGRKSKIEVPLGGATYSFRRLHWREEASLKQKKGSSITDALIMAFESVRTNDGRDRSTFTVDEKETLIKAIPISLRSKIYMLFYAETNSTRVFQVLHLYQPPELDQVVQIVEEEEERSAEERRKIMDKMDELETEQQILRNSGMRGVTRLTSEGDADVSS